MVDGSRGLLIGVRVLQLCGEFEMLFKEGGQRCVLHASMLVERLHHEPWASACGNKYIGPESLQKILHWAIWISS